MDKAIDGGDDKMKYSNFFFLFVICLFVFQFKVAQAYPLDLSMYDEDYDYSPGYSRASSYEYSDDNEYSWRREYKPNIKRGFDNYARKRFVGPGKVFVFDPKALRWYAYMNGDLVNTGRASGGRHYCADVHRPCRTPVGVFSIGQKGGPDCKSSKYPIGRGNAPMPWCMFFHRGFAIHGSYDVPGYNASHGCIRVLPSAAKWLNHYFLSPGTKVVVKGYRY